MSAPEFPWTSEKDGLLRSMGAAGESTAAIATLLKRTPDAVRKRTDIPLLNAETSLPDTDRFATEPSLTSEIISRNSFGRKAMKRLIVCTAVLGLAFSSAAQAKGCIKGAIVGGVAGSVAGHGKVGAAAGCVIGHHEANKAGAEKAAPQTTAPRNKQRTEIQFADSTWTLASTPAVRKTVGGIIGIVIFRGNKHQG
jgi:hypothetical protein